MSKIEIAFLQKVMLEINNPKYTGFFFFKKKKGNHLHFQLPNDFPKVEIVNFENQMREKGRP